MAVAATVRRRCASTAFKSIMARYAPAITKNAAMRPSSSHPASASSHDSTSEPAKVDAPASSTRKAVGNKTKVLSMEASRSGLAALGRKRMMPLGDPKATTCAKMVPHAVRMRSKPHPSSNPSKALGNTYMVLTAPNTSPVLRTTAFLADCLATIPMRNASWGKSVGRRGRWVEDHAMFAVFGV